MSGFTAEESIEFICNHYALSKIYNISQLKDDLEYLVNSMRKLRECTYGIGDIDITTEPVMSLYSEMCDNIDNLSRRYSLKSNHIAVNNSGVLIVIESLVSKELFTLKV